MAIAITKVHLSLRACGRDGTTEGLPTRWSSTPVPDDGDMSRCFNALSLVSGHHCSYHSWFRACWSGLPLR